MLLYALNEIDDEESRASLTPESARKLVALGMEVGFESGLGRSAGFADDAYLAAGARVMAREEALPAADIVFHFTPPAAALIGRMKAGAISLGFLAPFAIPGISDASGGLTAEQARIDALIAGRITGISVEMMPRSTIAQKMDAISSQANLAGYVAVTLAAARMGKVLPMMMTPSGTISPAKVFIIGVGVAGLQAIATAKRLGARVTAFDTRAEALEQAESLGAKALKIDLGDTGSTDQGYARELTQEQIALQKAGQAKACVESDVVICTAKLFGRRAPMLVGADVVAGMRAGSILVDLAAETGGNVEGTVAGEEIITPGGVRIIGHRRLECRVSRDASSMYANNLANFIEHFWDKESRTLREDVDDPILAAATLTRGGVFVNPHPAFKS